MKSRRRSERRHEERRPVGAVRALIRAINARRVDRIVALLADNHRFIDSLGNVVRGSKDVAAGFAAYFQMVPDYRIDVAHTLAEGIPSSPGARRAGVTCHRDGTLL
jgi:ketosteroid isomerase-like protein